MTTDSRFLRGWSSLVLLWIALTAHVDGLLLAGTRLSLDPRSHASHQTRLPTRSRSPPLTPYLQHSSPALTLLFDTAGDEDQSLSTTSSTGSVEEDAKLKEPTTTSDKSSEINKTGTTASKDTVDSNKTVVIEGIGGKGGLVYDVNRLKRNLLQETMASYKEELWDLLGSSVPANNQEVVEKLAALVQASPVRTTTDSNLLDGQDDWVLAYRSQYPTTVASLVLYDDADTTYVRSNKNKNINKDSSNAAPYNARYNFLWNTNNNNDNNSKNSANNKIDNEKGGVTKKSRTKNQFLQRNVFWNKLKEFFQTKQRTFRLEELADDEDSYVKDTTYVLGGLLTRNQQYALDGLTRSSLILHPLSTRWSLMGRWPSFNIQKNGTKSSGSNSNKEHRYVSFHIVYLDNDLCILTEQDGPDVPFMVYTRNKAYLDIFKSTKRKFKILRVAIGSLFQRRQDDRVSSSYSSSSLSRRKRRHGTAAAVDPILKEIIKNEARQRKTKNWNTNSSSTPISATKLRVLRLGDVNDDQEDESWESESDPFVHLSADERQRILKGMSVEEIEQTADAYRNSQTRFRWLRRLLGMGRRKKQTFKKPPEKWQRPRKR